uniref:uncharacterized protein n=1 Tax=Myxine glutinosa TaxID=7769 RepID=UPI00358F6265
MMTVTLSLFQFVTNLVAAVVAGPSAHGLRTDDLGGSWMAVGAGSGVVVPANVPGSIHGALLRAGKIQLHPLQVSIAKPRLPITSPPKPPLNMCSGRGRRAYPPVVIKGGARGSRDQPGPSNSGFQNDLVLAEFQVVPQEVYNELNMGWNKLNVSPFLEDNHHRSLSQNTTPVEIDDHTYVCDTLNFYLDHLNSKLDFLEKYKT